MSEDLKVLVERAEAQKEASFKITKDLFIRADFQDLVRTGLALYFGNDERKISLEMQGIDTFIADETTLSFFRTERRAPYMVWGMVTEFMKQNPKVSTKELEEAFLKQLPQRIHDAYSASAATASY